MQCPLDIKEIMRGWMYIYGSFCLKTNLSWVTTMSVFGYKQYTTASLWYNNSIWYMYACTSPRPGFSMYMAGNSGSCFYIQSRRVLSTILLGEDRGNASGKKTLNMTGSTRDAKGKWSWVAGTREVFRKQSECRTDVRNQGFGAASKCFFSPRRESEKTMEGQMRVGEKSREQAIG